MDILEQIEPQSQRKYTYIIIYVELNQLHSERKINSTVTLDPMEAQNHFFYRKGIWSRYERLQIYHTKVSTNRSRYFQKDKT